MILVDTSVWIDRLRASNAGLVELLTAGKALAHPMVVGELACGALSDRLERLRAWRALPALAERPHEEVLEAIESRRLMSRGVGFIDVHLLCAVLHREGASLWTLDKRLHRLAEELGVAFSGGSGSADA